MCPSYSLHNFAFYFRNSFSQLVGEEFLKYYEFANDPVDIALRKFLKHLTMTSELQDRDQLLAHFAHRYFECNPSACKSEGKQLRSFDNII